jgi:tryptophan-rich sensory protein
MGISNIRVPVATFSAVLLTAIFGSRFLPGSWYESLAKPTWNPPNWVFGPAWTVLYIAIAVAGWLVWRAPAARGARLLWCGQLVLNAAWSWLFFGLHRADLALADIAVMLLLILAFVVVCWRPNRRAALLFVPYALWVGFALSLNLAIVVLN